jgi:hypothetical protein
MTPRTSDQPVARPLPKHRITQTQNKRICTQNIHSLNRIRTHNPRIRTREDSLCLRPCGYFDRLNTHCLLLIIRYSANILVPLLELLPNVEVSGVDAEVFWNDWRFLWLPLVSPYIPHDTNWIWTMFTSFNIQSNSLFTNHNAIRNT